MKSSLPLPFTSARTPFFGTIVYCVIGLRMNVACCVSRKALLFAWHATQKFEPM